MLSSTYGRCHSFKWQPSRYYFECASSQVVDSLDTSKTSSNRHKNKTRNFLLSPACHCKACLRILALQVPAVESGVLRPPAHAAHRGWCLVQAPQRGGSSPRTLGVRAFGGLKAAKNSLASVASPLWLSETTCSLQRVVVVDLAYGIYGRTEDWYVLLLHSA
jgi:hypothetical protein